MNLLNRLRVRTIRRAAHLTLAVAPAVMLCGSMPQGAMAATAITNLSNSTASNWLSLGLLGAPGTIAASFTPTSTFTLDNAVLRLNINAVATPIVSIWTHDSGTGFPASVLYTLTNPSPFTTGYANWTFTAPVNAELTAGTKYYLVLQRVAGGTINWNSSGGVEPTGPLATYSGSYRRTTGGDWSVATGVPVFALNAVPTPAAAGLLAVGGLVATRRRRQG